MAGWYPKDPTRRTTAGLGGFSVWSVRIPTRKARIQRLSATTTDTWQFHANTIRFASAMGGGGDYGVYAGGRYQLTQASRAMNDWLNLRKKFDTSVKK